MLSEENNKLLTEVGPGTPMGRLLRHYWLPIGGGSEFRDVAVRPIRLLGEDLVLFKDRSGSFGLVDRHCPHRRADLAYGYVEDCGIRCHYHGWQFDPAGRCIAQPYDDVVNPNSGFKDRIRLKAYPVEARAGLLWAYLGDRPAPFVPDWEPFHWKNGFVQIVISDLPCNWFQCQENSIDPVHFEWMHYNWSQRLQGQPGPYSPKHVKVDFEEFDYGFVYKRILESTDASDPLWTIGRVCLWPNALFTGDHFEWRVPVDDTSTRSITWHFTRVPREREPYVQEEVPTWHGPIKDPRTGEWLTSHVMNQDFVAWLGQGTIADRTQEHLGQSDRGIALMRRRFLSDLQAVARGEDPKGVIRSNGATGGVPLPVIPRKELVEGLTRDETVRHPTFSRFADRYIFQAGQPDWVKRAYEAATGFRLSDEQRVGI
jgi:5,5'-dehydrodivanillate O-demethylase